MPPRSHRPNKLRLFSSEALIRRQGVGNGDLFLFFGLFRAVEKTASGWRYVLDSLPLHSLFGWLQVADRIPVAAWPVDRGWALQHPHFADGPEASNVIYTATEQLALISSQLQGVAGAGAFPRISLALRLTAPDSAQASHWLLPKWFHPEGCESTLTYHSDLIRWEKTGNGVLLSSVSRGEEFVLDCDHYPEAIRHILALISENKKS